LLAALARRLADDDPDVRSAAAAAVGRLGEAAIRYLPQAISELHAHVAGRTRFQSVASSLFVEWPDLRVFETDSGWLIRSLSELSSGGSSPDILQAAQTAGPHDAPAA
jgi:hypothetical protein